MGPGSGMFSGADAPADDDLYKCVHCGFCHQACPTYVETGLETESPRGRIALMTAVKEGRIGVTPAVLGHWDLCIQCRACEAACPAGVPYGRLIESTMAQVEKLRKPALPVRLAAAVTLKHVFPHQRRLSMLVNAVRLYRRTGLRSILRRSGFLRLVSGRLHELDGSLPDIKGPALRSDGKVHPAQGTCRAMVGLLSGCVMPLVQGPQMRSVIRVLTRNGCDVVVPKAQVCCGAVNSHVGDLATARALARRNIDAFAAADVDTVVVASAGCGARMKGYGELLRHDPEYRDSAERFDSSVKDIHEFLAGLPLEPPSAWLPMNVTYQDSCHLSHGQRITDQPRELLRAIPGVELTEMANSSRCCGAGGTYTLTQREFSLRLLDNKMRSVADTGAEVLATANPGCVLQLGYGVQRAELPVEVRYVTELLDEAYSREENPPA